LNPAKQVAGLEVVSEDKLTIVTWLRVLLTECKKLLTSRYTKCVHLLDSVALSRFQAATRCMTRHIINV
jgi:hypothetical protein